MDQSRMGADRDGPAGEVLCAHAIGAPTSRKGAGRLGPAFERHQSDRANELGGGMRWTRTLLSWLQAFLRRERVERELEAELQFYLEQETAERLAAGQPAGEARTAALRSLGSVALAKDGCRDSLGLRVADG